MNYKELYSGVDLATRELLFINELAKIGAIKLNMNIPKHQQTLKELGLLLDRYTRVDTLKMSEFERIDFNNKSKLWTMIVLNIAANVIPKG